MAEVPTFYHFQDPNLQDQVRNVISKFGTKKNFTSTDFWKLEQATKGKKLKLNKILDNYIINFFIFFYDFMKDYILSIIRRYKVWWQDK